MTILSSSDFLLDYVDLHQDFDYGDYIIPPVGHPRHVDGDDIFKNMSKILHHLLKYKGIINSQNAPAASLAPR